MRYVITYLLPHHGQHITTTLCRKCAKNYPGLGGAEHGERKGYCHICDADADDPDPPLATWLSCGQDW